MKKSKFQLDLQVVKKALRIEKKLAYMVPSGKYWKVIEKFDPLNLNEIDNYWLKTPLNV